MNFTDSEKKYTVSIIKDNNTNIDKCKSCDFYKYCYSNNFVIFTKQLQFEIDNKLNCFNGEGHHYKFMFKSIK